MYLSSNKQRSGKPQLWRKIFSISTFFYVKRAFNFWKTLNVLKGFQNKCLIFLKERKWNRSCGIFKTSYLYYMMQTSSAHVGLVFNCEYHCHRSRYRVISFLVCEKIFLRHSRICTQQAWTALTSYMKDARGSWNRLHATKLVRRYDQAHHENKCLYLYLHRNY